jgi:phosphotransferase system  glucose/maltose/N-acetylglucosamine-specific IIC component
VVEAGTVGQQRGYRGHESQKVGQGHLRGMPAIMLVAGFSAAGRSMSCIVLCCAVLCCTILYYTILYYTILYGTRTEEARSSACPRVLR